MMQHHQIDASEQGLEGGYEHYGEAIPAAQRQSYFGAFAAASAEALMSSQSLLMAGTHWAGFSSDRGRGSMVFFFWLYWVFIVVRGLLQLWHMGLVALGHVRSQFPHQGSNPFPLHWKADSKPLAHQGQSQRVFICQRWCSSRGGTFAAGDFSRSFRSILLLQVFQSPCSKLRLLRKSLSAFTSQSEFSCLQLNSDPYN